MLFAVCQLLIRGQKWLTMERMFPRSRTRRCDASLTDPSVSVSRRNVYRFATPDRCARQENSTNQRDIALPASRERCEGRDRSTIRCWEAGA